MYVTEDEWIRLENENKIHTIQYTDRNGELKFYNYIWVDKIRTLEIKCK